MTSYQIRSFPQPFDLCIQEVFEHDQAALGIIAHPTQIRFPALQLKREEQRDRILESISEAIQCHACMLYLIDEKHSLKLTAIKANPDYPLFEIDFVHGSLCLAKGAFYSNTALSISRHTRENGNSVETTASRENLDHQSEHSFAIPMYTGVRPIGVLCLVFDHPIQDPEQKDHLFDSISLAISAVLSQKAQRPIISGNGKQSHPKINEVISQSMR
jgi:transcriptional regulator with GAF, ATPase, and Fis domain